MYKLFVFAAILAFAFAAPAPEPKPVPGPKPDPLVYSAGYVAAAPVAYSSYVASPVVSSYAYPAYAGYSAPLVYV